MTPCFVDVPGRHAGGSGLGTKAKDTDLCFTQTYFHCTVKGTSAVSAATFPCHPVRTCQSWCSGWASEWVCEWVGFITNALKSRHFSQPRISLKFWLSIIPSFLVNNTVSSSVMLTMYAKHVQIMLRIYVSHLIQTGPSVRSWEQNV